MIYAEFIRRDRGLPLEMFRHFGRQDWQSDEDVMVANLGRTMKLGPEQAMCWWKIAGMSRMDGWEAFFRSDEGRLYAAESPVARALDFHRCGLYDALVEGEAVGQGLHLVEFFDPGTASDEDLVELFSSRGRRPAWLLRSLGRMAPPPGGIALWSFGSYVEAEPFLRLAPPPGCRVEDAGLYRRFEDAVA